MRAVAIGETALHECEECLGLWLSADTLERICTDREEQAAMFGSAIVSVARSDVPAAGAGRIRYVPCPECRELMNRVNFAKCSGVVVDVCKRHGTWFDRDELRKIIEFIRSGGFDLARSREKAEIEEERKKLELERAATQREATRRSLGSISDEETSGLFVVARALFDFFT